jgi:hypothetical protein
MTFIEALKKHNIPDTSYLKAIEYITDQEKLKGKLTLSQYQERINEIDPVEGEIEDVRLAEYTYKYLIQETLRAIGEDKIDVNIYEMHRLAIFKAEEFIKRNSYLWESEDKSTKLDAEGKVKSKRGSKKEATCQLWSERKDDGLTRQEWIKLLVEEVGCTKSGGSTYYARLKNGTFGC